MAILTREAILGAQDLKRQTVNVPEWGPDPQDPGQVIVTEMSAARRIEFERKLVEDEDQMRIILVAFCVVNEAGEQLFSVEDAQALGKKNFKAIRRVSQVALRLNRIGAEQESELQEDFPESQG